MNRYGIRRLPAVLVMTVALFGTVLSAQKTAVFAGGCFWGVEGVFEHVKGVQEVRSGYAGGTAATAKYYTVTTGLTNHAESVEVVYDPEAVSYETLLEIFFVVAHNPTQLNYQGADVGRHYRSVIFYVSDEQRQAAQSAIADIERRGLYPDKIVTALDPLDKFYPAEGYHQDFMRKNPEDPYVVYWDWPKIEHLEEEYPDLYVDIGWSRR